MGYSTSYRRIQNFETNYDDTETRTQINFETSYGKMMSESLEFGGRAGFSNQDYRQLSSVGDISSKSNYKYHSGAWYGKSYYPFFQFMAAFADLSLRYTRMRSSTTSTGGSSVVNSGSGNDFGIGLGAGFTGFIGKHWSAQLGFGLGQVGYIRARSQSAIGSSLVGATQSSDFYIISNIFSASATNLGIYYAF